MREEGNVRGDQHGGDVMGFGVDGEELDRITGLLMQEAYISQAFWSPSSSDRILILFQNDQKWK